MTIDKIYIKSFGNLENFKFIPQKGINVIYGKNESGKSTLAAFIRFIFYGFSSKKLNNSSIRASDRYLNWNTHLASGALELTSNSGAKYRIEREFYLLGKKSNGSVKVICLDDGEILSNAPHEIFLGGVSEEVFNRTLFISQSSGTSVDSDVIYTSVENMISGADEDVNTKKALAKLDSARTGLLYKNEKGGKIYQIRKAIDDLNEKKLAVSQQGEQILRLKAEAEQKSCELINIKKHIENTEKTIDDLENAQRLEHIKNTIAAKEKIEKLEKARDEYVKKATKNGFFPKKEYLLRLDAEIGNYYSLLEEMKNLNSKKDQLQKKFDDDRDIGSINKNSAKPIASAVSFENKKRQKLYKLSQYSLITLGIFVLLFAVSLIALPDLRILMGAITVVCIIFFASFKVLIRSCEKTVAALLSSVGAGSIEELNSLCKNENRISEHRDSIAGQIAEIKGLIHQNDKKLKRILENYTYLSKKYGVVCQSISQCETFRNDVRQKVEEFEKISSVITRTKNQYQLNGESYTEEEYNMLKSKELPQFPDSFTLHSTLMEEKRKKRRLEEQADEAGASLTDTKMQLSSLMAGFEDVEIIDERISLLNKQLERLLFVHKAISLASEALEKASTASRNRIAPNLSKLSSQIISDATDGKYEKITVDSKLKLSYIQNESTRDIGYLSEGTKDVVYIAYRISLVSVLFEDTPPIVIDEGFAGMDDQRLEATLNAVSIHAKNKDSQIFIFSPTTRESAVASGLGANVFIMP